MSLQNYFDHYERAHLNKTNKLFHSFGIPIIIVSLGLLLFTVHKTLGWALFIFGWVLQIAGHAVEGTRPEFLQNPIYLLIGPLYFLEKIRRKLAK